MSPGPAVTGEMGGVSWVGPGPPSGSSAAGADDPGVLCGSVQGPLAYAGLGGVTDHLGGLRFPVVGRTEELDPLDGGGELRRGGRVLGVQLIGGAGVGAVVPHDPGDVVAGGGFQPVGECGGPGGEVVLDAREEAPVGVVGVGDHLVAGSGGADDPD